MREADNFGTLAEISLQVHVYGTAGEPLLKWCADKGFLLHQFDFSASHAKAGLARDAAYLIRPDTYVAAAAEQCDATALERYFTTHITKREPY